MSPRQLARKIPNEPISAFAASRESGRGGANVGGSRYSPNGLFPNAEHFAKDASEEINTNQQNHEGNIIFVG
jgi:hypothetical protein